MEPTEGDEAMALRLRDNITLNRHATVEAVWQLDVYRARRVLVALLDLHSDADDDEFRRRWGAGS